MNKELVCVCVAHYVLQKQKGCLTNFRILLIFSHVCEW